MKELYFINVIGNLNTVAWVLFSVLCIAAIMSGIAYYIEDIDKDKAKKVIKPIVIILAVCFFAGVFFANEKRYVYHIRCRLCG